MFLKSDRQAPPVHALRVEDMSCGHCAQTIIKAIRGAWPAAKIEADPVTKLVRVAGVAEVATLRDIIVGAGYTPGAEIDRQV